MSQRHTISGRRPALIWLSLLIVLLVATALVVTVLFIYPNHQRQQQVEQHYQAGVAFQDAGDWDKAVEVFEKVVVIDATYKDARTRLAEVKAKQQEELAQAQAKAVQATATAQARAEATSVAATTEAKVAQATSVAATATAQAEATAQIQEAKATTQAQATQSAQAQTTATAQAQANVAATVAAAPTATLQVLEAHYQRALGLINLQQWAEAQVELRVVFDTDPNYKDVQSQLALANAEVAKLTPTSTSTPLATPTPITTPTSLISTPTATKESCREWNLPSDFQVWPNHENPNRDSCGNPGVWHFMGSATLDRNPSTYYLLPRFVTDSYGKVGLLMWRDMNADFPGVAFNATGVDIGMTYGMTWSANAIWIHPGSSKLVIIGWRSPISGNVKIMGSVLDGQTGDVDDGINWYIDKGSIALAAGSVDPGGGQNLQSGLGGSSLTEVAINQGEFIYLIIHPRGHHYCDPTFIELTISKTQ